MTKVFRLVATLFLLCFQSIVWATEPLPSGGQFDIGFSPKGGSLDTVLRAIQGANREILVAAYSFTSKPIALALLDASKRGVSVKVVADAKDNLKSFSATTYLANAGVPVRLNDRYAILHDKYMVIDGESVELGSFNYSAAAVTSNAENVLVLWHVKPVADRYKLDWQRLWDEGQPLAKSY